jgi:hypothetical protein
MAATVRRWTDPAIVLKREARAWLVSVLILDRRSRCEPPPVSFKIPRAVLALPIWLIDRLRIDQRTSRAGSLVVRVHIIHMHEKAGVGNVGDAWGIEPMFRGHPVKPDCGVTRTDLAMNGLTFRVSMYTPAIEAEGIDEKVVSRWDVLVGQNRNDPLETGHDVLLVPARPAKPIV